MKFLLLVVFAVFYIDLVNAKDKKQIYKELFDKMKAAKDSNEKPVIFNQTVMKINKKGGRMMLVRKGQILQVQVKSITERFQNETVRENVALKDLDCTASKEKTADNEYNIEAAALSLQCSFPNNAQGALEFYLFKADGDVEGEDGNLYEIKQGGVKMNIKITNWPNDAEILDVTFGMKCGLAAMKGKIPKKLKDKIIKRKPGAAKRRAAQAFSVCPEARGTFAANFKDGTEDKDMPEPFPKSGDELKDSEAEVTLRFSGSQITYDPTVEVGDDIAEENASDSSPAMSFLPNIVLMLVAFVVGQIKLF